MATRLFFRETTNLNTNYPTAGDKSTALPVGTDGGDFNQNQDLSLQNGPTTATNLTYASLAQTAQQSAMIARFTSPRLRSQTVNANTWTIAFTADESNAAANAFLAISAYIWRPSTSSVVGFIRDSATTLGVEFNNSLQTVTFSGSAVTAEANDILVIEAWNVATQAMATSYTITFTTSASGTQRYIETPQDLAFTSNEQVFIID
jgi:hypothetical protein